MGYSYAGPQSVSATGKRCLPWDNVTRVYLETTNSKFAEHRRMKHSYYFTWNASAPAGRYRIDHNFIEIPSNLKLDMT